MAGCFLWIGAATLLLAASPVEEETPLPAGDDFAANIRRVFADDQMADIRVTFGYDDSKDFDDPWDPLRAANFIDYLESHSFKAMEVTEDLAEELGVTLAARNLRVFTGPGARGQTLRIAMIWSSATSKTWQNIGSQRNLQLRRSDEALRFMQRAAVAAEVQVYLGHSRAGGGPDTYPPVTVDDFVKKRRKVDYSHYAGLQPGLGTLGAHFKRSREKPAIIVWTSCATDRHFGGWFADKLAGKTHATSIVLSTRLAYRDPRHHKIEGFDEGLMATVRLIEALRNHKSKDEFLQGLLACELDDRRKPLKPAWKLISVPGAGDNHTKIRPPAQNSSIPGGVP
jgi:hypothetical protein